MPRKKDKPPDPDRTRHHVGVSGATIRRLRAVSEQQGVTRGGVPSAGAAVLWLLDEYEIRAARRATRDR